jgi:hypothetical protein
MKKLSKTIVQPVQVLEDVTLAIEESIHDKISWTAAMPNGALTKLKKVCKPVATRDGLTIWVLDDKKVRFIQK